MFTSDKSILLRLYIFMQKIYYRGLNKTNFVKEEVVK